MKVSMLTTIDNPYNPFDEFDLWWNFDVQNSYGTCEYLARIAKTSDQLSDEENNIEIERAINEIIKLDPLNMYVKVSQDSEGGV